MALRARNRAHNRRYSATGVGVRRENVVDNDGCDGNHKCYSHSSHNIDEHPYCEGFEGSACGGATRFSTGLVWLGLFVEGHCESRKVGK